MSHSKGLNAVAAALSTMQQEAVADGHAMLALLLQLARDEALEERARREDAETEAACRPPPSNVIPFPVRGDGAGRRARA